VVQQTTYVSLWYGYVIFNQKIFTVYTGTTSKKEKLEQRIGCKAKNVTKYIYMFSVSGGDPSMKFHKRLWQCVLFYIGSRVLSMEKG
jgi:hypothetical protein